MIKAYPKIFSIGQDYIRDIFKEEVVVEEKLDGSQFCFGKIDGELHFRSKGKVQHVGAVDKMFQPVVEFIQVQEWAIPNNTIFYSELLNKCKHNTLKYNRTPTSKLMLFGMSDSSGTKFETNYLVLERFSHQLAIDPPRILYKGKIESIDFLMSLLDRESYLGGPNIEGVVVKNFHRPFMLGGQPIPAMFGKLVSEKFKEIHQKGWSKEKTNRGKWAGYVEAHRTEARWMKGIQHLTEKGELEYSPRDIGNLIREIKADIEEEEKENIKEFLWREFGQEFLRRSTSGLPEFYKEWLAKRSFEDEQ